jgi:uncharacterized membrane protein
MAMEQAYRRYCRAAAVGFVLGTPFAIPLGVPENVFHLLVSIPALAVVLLHLRSARRPLPERG